MPEIQHHFCNNKKKNNPFQRHTEKHQGVLFARKINIFYVSSSLPSNSMSLLKICKQYGVYVPEEKRANLIESGHIL